jgi:hypothetical protein
LKPYWLVFGLYVWLKQHEEGAGVIKNALPQAWRLAKSEGKVDNINWIQTSHNIACVVGVEPNIA